MIPIRRPSGSPVAIVKSWRAAARWRVWAAWNTEVGTPEFNISRGKPTAFGAPKETDIVFDPLSLASYQEEKMRLLVVLSIALVSGTSIVHVSKIRPCPLDLGQLPLHSKRRNLTAAR